MTHSETNANPRFAKAPEHYIFPTSISQERLWFLDRLEPGSATYTIAQAFRLRGALDVNALQAAINVIVARHESLRTFFAWQEENPVQVIASDLEVPLTVVDLSSPEGATVAEAVRLARQEAQRPFDLNKLPLLRTVLYRLAEHDYVLFLVMHHIISDGWSLEVLYRELAAFYGANVRGEDLELPELPIQYADYAVWQRQWLEGENMSPLIAYWKQQLDRAPVLELPTDYPRPATRTHEGARIPLQLSPAVADRLRELSRIKGVTLFMTLLAAFEVLLARWSGATDVVVGTPIAGRNRREIEDLIGFFLNTLVLRTDLSDNPTYTELLARVQSTALSAYEHQDLSFERLLQVLRPPRDQSRTPLFQVFFNMLPITKDFPDLPGIHVELLPPLASYSNFDLTLYVFDTQGTIDASVVYNVRLFAPERMQALAEEYVLLLEQIAAHPDERISNYSLVTPHALPLLPDPRAPLSAAWRGSIQARLGENAARHPGQIAIVASDGNWSYQTLDRRANQLANGLLAHGVGRGDVVAIYGHRSAALVWAIMGVLKAAATILILDPAYPAARLITYLQIAKPTAWIQLEEAGAPDADLKRYVAENPFVWRVMLPPAARIEASDVLKYPVDAPDAHVEADDIACITFTSGTTGQPRGVLGRHGPLTHFIPWQAEIFGLDASARFSMLSGLAHDPLQRDIFTPLWLGATICIPHPDAIGTPGALAEWAAQQGVTFAHLTPSMALLLTETSDPNLSFPALRGAFFIGDKLTRNDVSRLRKLAPNVVCIGSYGLTETQRAVGYYVIPPDAGQSPLQKVYPSGRGMPDVQLLVLNGTQQPAGIGELGEIYVRSPHLAKGYLDDQALTRARFTTNPWSNDPEDRLYRTGDLGRYLPDGNVEFFGRADRQLKLRGFRIEPAEIEGALLEHHAVREAVVTLIEPPSQEARLAAYLVAAKESVPPSQDLRSFLKRRLPEHMVPAEFVLLPRLPLTPNSKIDFSALPLPSARLMSGEAGVFRTNTERQLAEIWERVLNVPEVSREDDFFDLGGHSLLAVRLFAQIESQFGKKMPVALLFRAPTVEQLAQAIEGDVESPLSPTVVPIRSTGSKPPFFCVHGLGGGVIGYSELARQISSDHPFYGLQALGLYGDEPQYKVEAMAAHYIQAMRQVQPQGPYYLGGYCYGGIVAFEMARQLEAAGLPVAGIAIFEGYAISRASARRQLWRPSALARTMLNLPYWLVDYGPRAYTRISVRLKRGSRTEWQETLQEMDRRVALLQPHELAFAEEIPAAHRRVIAAHLEALQVYEPQPYHGRVTLFRVRALSLFRAADPTMGWGRLARGGVEIKMIPGAHHNILERPYVNELAKQLEGMLAL